VKRAYQVLLCALLSEFAWNLSKQLGNNKIIKYIKRLSMTQRQNISSGAIWEDIVGYSRAVRVGNQIEVAGTTAIEQNGEVVGINDPFEQTRFIISKIEKALIEAGATLKDVVRTRMFVTDITQWEEIGKAHGLYFKDIKPAATMVEVKSLISPELLVEIEATALVVEK